MSQNELFTCPECYAEVPGTAGIMITCSVCTFQFRSELPSAFEEDELMLAPLEDPPVITPRIPAAVIGNADTTFHLEAEVSRPDQSCTKCDQLFDVDAIECPHCGFNKALGRKLDPSELDPCHLAFGFDRYLMRHTQDNNAGGLMLWLHAFLTFVGIATMLVWKGWTYYVVPTMGVLYAIYRVRAYYACSFQRGKGIIPSLLLLYNRTTTWKGFGSAIHSDSILSMRSFQFNDSSIASIDNREAIEILDIAGSSITDNGVRYLSTFPNLKALVVVKCDVGEEALDELQVAIPEVCIWRP